MFFLPPLAVENFHAAKNARSMRQVDDEVPFLEVEEAVDRPRFETLLAGAVRRISTRSNSSLSLMTTICSATSR